MLIWWQRPLSLDDFFWPVNFLGILLSISSVSENGLGDIGSLSSVFWNGCDMPNDMMVQKTSFNQDYPSASCTVIRPYTPDAENYPSIHTCGMHDGYNNVTLRTISE